MTIDLERLREEIVGVVRRALATADQQHPARLRCLLVVEAVTNSFNSNAFAPTILSVDETIHFEQNIDMKHQDPCTPIFNFNNTSTQKRRKPQMPQKIVREDEQLSLLTSFSGISQQLNTEKDSPIDFSCHRNEKLLETSLSSFIPDKLNMAGSTMEVGHFDTLKKSTSDSSLFPNFFASNPLVAHFQQMLASGSSYYPSSRPPIPSILPFGTSVGGAVGNVGNSRDNWMSSPMKIPSTLNNFINSSGAANFLPASGLGFGINNFTAHNTKFHTDSSAQQNKNGSSITTPTTSLNRANGHPRATRIGNKIFKCNQCNEKFSSLNLLSKHTFSMHRSFRCTICGANFTQRSNLQRHSLKHVGFKPFVCNCCSKAYYRKDHLVRHIEVTHPGVDPRASITVKLSSSESLEYLEKINVNSPTNIAAIKEELDLDEVFSEEDFAEDNESEASFNTNNEIEGHIQLPLEEGEIIPMPGIDNFENMEYLADEIISHKNDINKSQKLDSDHPSLEAASSKYNKENVEKNEFSSLSLTTSPLCLNLKLVETENEKIKCLNEPMLMSH